MPKVGMEPIRKKQLIEATIASIHKQGFAATTVKEIGASAGVSPGIIHHYFGGKNELLEATMHQLLKDIRILTIKGLKKSTTPTERIEAIIKANFAEDFFSQQSLTAWLAFWAQVPHMDGFRRLQRINEKRLLSNLRYDFAKLIPDYKQSKKSALGLAVMMDGLWVRCAVHPSLMGPKKAREMTKDYLQTQLKAYGH